MKDDRLTIYGAIAATIGLILFGIFAWNRFVTDFWPPDRSFIGPNIVASAVLLSLGVLAIFKRMKREHAHLHAKLDHIVKHSPDIPDFPHKDGTR